MGADVGEEGVGVVAPEHWDEFEGGLGGGDGGGGEGLVVVVPGEGGVLGEEDGVVGWVLWGGDVDEAALGEGAGGQGEEGGEEEEEGEGEHCGGLGGGVEVWGGGVEDWGGGRGYIQPRPPCRPWTPPEREQ